MNTTVDIQWQPRNDLAIDIGYVNAPGPSRGDPIPFNQARIASPSNPLCGPAAVCASPGQCAVRRSLTPTATPSRARPALVTILMRIIVRSICRTASPWSLLPKAATLTCECLTSALRHESEEYIAEGVSDYNALQTHLEKRLSHGLQAGRFLHLLPVDGRTERPGPLLQRQQSAGSSKSAYGLSDFDRPTSSTLTITTNLPKFAFAAFLWKGKSRTVGPSKASSSFKTASPTASLTIRAPWAAFSTASTTESQIPSFRWLPAARPRARSLAPAAQVPGSRL